MSEGYGAAIAGEPPTKAWRESKHVQTILGRTNWVDWRHRLDLTLLLHSNPSEPGEKLSKRELTRKVCGRSSQEDK